MGGNEKESPQKREGKNRVEALLEPSGEREHTLLPFSWLGGERDLPEGKIDFPPSAATVQRLFQKSGGRKSL